MDARISSKGCRRRAQMIFNLRKRVPLSTDTACRHSPHGSLLPTHLADGLNCPEALILSVKPAGVLYGQGIVGIDQKGLPLWLAEALGPCCDQAREERLEVWVCSHPPIVHNGQTN